MLGAQLLQASRVFGDDALAHIGKARRRLIHIHYIYIYMYTYLYMYVLYIYISCYMLCNDIHVISASFL